MNTTLDQKSPGRKPDTLSDWPHSPPHRTLQTGTYFITGATYQKECFFKSKESLSFLQLTLLNLLKKYSWEVQAWAIFPNHYHFIASNTSTPENLSAMISEFHVTTARRINERDNTQGRKVWFQFWDVFISYPGSYFPRLKYVHNNAVHHKLVKSAEDYPWCSASWFNAKAPESFKKTVNRFKIDRLNIPDSF